MPRAITPASTSVEIGTLRICTLRICSRPRISGKPTVHLAVETARTHQGLVEHVGAVGRGDHDDAGIRLEAIHFDQQLIQRLFALVVAAADAGAAMTADSVDFVDEHDARRMFLGVFKHVAHPRRADADKHFDEVGTGNA